VRYVTGDVAVVRGAERCACGRSLARLERIDGRLTEALVDGEGGRVSGLLVAVAMATFGQGIEAFQVIQHRDKVVTVRVVCTHLPVRVENRLRAHIAPYLRGLPLRFERVSSLPIDASGKRKQVIVEQP